MTSATATAAVATRHRYATVYVEDMALGIDIDTVQEIVAYHDTTPVPLAHPSIRGLINLRGQIVTAIDLRDRLALPPADPAIRPFNVIVTLEGRVVSLLVDGFGDVVEFFEPADDVPQTLTGIARELVTGVHQLDDRLLLVLDAPTAIELSEGPAASDASAHGTAAAPGEVPA